ncbi:MAG: ABC transporter permease [Nitrososphaerales archaeon]
MNGRNIWIVIKYEIISMLRRPSFWFFTFVFPVMIMVFTFLPQIFAQRAFSEAGTVLSSAMRGPAVPYVDLAGVIQDIPAGVKSSFQAYATEAEAKAALEDGNIPHYFLIPADFRQSGKVVAVAKHPSPVSGMNGSNTLEYVLRYNLAGGAASAAAIAGPIARLDELNLAPATEAKSRNPQEREFSDFILPFGVMFILFFIITMSAGFMLQSVSREKENRTAELLLTSLSPRELMLGKVVGLGIIALVQMAIWMGGGQFLLVGGAVAAVALAGKGLSLAFFAWAIVFFILGYIVYSAALGALGALAPTMREGSQFTFVLLIPLLIPLWLNNVFFQDPNGPFATALSLFPLTAPTAMVTRLAAGGVPAWQPWAALAGLVVTAYLFVLLAARFFRADTLLSNASISWGRIASELRGR